MMLQEFKNQKPKFIYENPAVNLLVLELMPLGSYKFIVTG